jgi:hypothetical protein
MLKLTKKERNEVFTAIERKGLDPQRFSWTTHISNFVTVYEEHYYQAVSGHRPEQAEALVTVHEGREFSFTFERDDKGTFFASVEPHINVGHGVRSQSWVGLLGAFNEWLEIVSYEIHEPDFWSQLPHDAPLATIPRNYASEERFTAEEVLTLRDRLKEIEAFILDTNAVHGAPAIQVQQTFIYLQHKAETATKLDWKNIFAGAIVSILLSLAVDNAPAIFSLCNRLLNEFFEKFLA